MSITTDRERVYQVAQQLSEGLRELTRDVFSPVDDLQPSTQDAVREAREDLSELGDAGTLPGCQKLTEQHEAVFSGVRERVGACTPPLERVKAETCAALSLAGPLKADDASAVEAKVQDLARAQSLDEAQRLQHDVLETLEQGHRSIFVENLAFSTAQAARRIGFDEHVRVLEVPSGDVRIEATNAKGQTIVSEVRDDGDGDPSLASEVVNVWDESCHQIMDRFDDALAKEGVRVRGDVTRQKTRGRYALEAAREFMARDMKPTSCRARSEDTASHGTSDNSKSQHSTEDELSRTTTSSGDSTSKQKRRRRHQSRQDRQHQ